MSSKLVIKNLVFLVCLFSTVFSSHYEYEDTIDVIFKHAQSAIKYIEKGKIFLDQRKVCIHEGKIFIEDDEYGAIELPNIFSSKEGLYLAGNPKMPMTQIWICANPTCLLKHYYEPSRCMRCQGTSFQVRYEIPPGNQG